MKYTTTAAAALLASSTLASAGGIERSNQSVAFMFEKGGYTEFSINRVRPDVSGTANPGAGGAASGDMAGNYTNVGLAVKWDANERLSFGIQYEQPYGADVDYPAGTGYPLAGTTATVRTDEIKLLARYKLEGGWSVHGGLRFQQAKGNVALPGYTMTANNSSELGYLVGVAYEKPEIALRVALTYNSEVTHKFSVTENATPSLPFETTMPQSINLEAQSGIAEGTLILGSIRWVNWSAFDITPAGYAAANGGASLVDYEHDTITYTLGIARRFTDNFAGIATIGYEKAHGDTVGNLGPTDGRTSISLAGRYDVGNATITGGVNYTWLGDAKTNHSVLPYLGDFQDNHAVGVGVRIGYHF